MVRSNNSQAAATDLPSSVCDQGFNGFWNRILVASVTARAGLSEPEAVVMTQAIARAATDEEWRDRVRAAKDAVRHVIATDQGAGLPTMAELLGDKAAHTIAGWLDYQERRWSFKGYAGPGPQAKPAQPEPPEPPVQPAQVKPAPGAQAKSGGRQAPPWPELPEPLPSASLPLNRLLVTVSMQL